MKNKLYFLLFLFAFNICRAQNIVLNAGFETATIGLPIGTPLTPYPTVVDEWSAVNVDGEFMYDTALAHTGNGFLSVLQNPGGNPRTFWLGAAGDGGYDRAIQVIPVLPSTTYELDFWVRSGNSLRYSGYGAGRLLVQIEQESPTFLQIDSFSVFTPLVWEQSILSFTTGSTCTSIALLFSSYSIDAVDAWVDDVDIHVSLASDLATPNLLPSVSLYPNPVTNQLNVQVGNSDISEIKLYDVSARKLVQKTFTKTAIIHTEALVKGLYFYEIRNGNTVIQKGKFLKE